MFLGISNVQERTQHLMAKLRERKEQREQQLLELAEEHGTAPGSCFRVTRLGIRQVAADTEHLEQLGTA